MQEPRKQTNQGDRANETRYPFRSLSQRVNNSLLGAASYYLTGNGDAGEYIARASILIGAFARGEHSLVDSAEPAVTYSVAKD